MSEEDFNIDEFFEDALPDIPREEEVEHLSDATLLAYHYHKLGEEAADGVKFHLMWCVKCQETYEDVKEYAAKLHQAVRERIPSYEQVKEYKRKRESYKVTQDFLKRFYPQKVKLLANIWDFLKDRSLADVLSYGLPGGAAPLGAFGATEEEDEVGEVPLKTLSSIASLLEEADIMEFEEIQDISPTHQEELIQKLAKKYQIPDDLKQELQMFLPA